MRIFTSAMLASSLLISGAFAHVPLSPGKPAGVKQAQFDNRNLEIVIIGAGLLIGIGVLIAVDKSKASSSTGTASP